MKLAIFQPYFFPYIGYFQLIHSADKFVVYDDVNYDKGGWINRNKIMIQGAPSWFTLEIYEASQNKHINELLIGKNRDKLIKTLTRCYSKAPFFSDTIEIIAAILAYQEDNLADFLANELKMVCDYLNIQTEFLLSSQLQKNKLLKGEEKIRHICEILGADTYINSIGGRKLYDCDIFKNDGFDLYFLQTDPTIQYQQFKNDFIPNLSIIDVMMFNSQKTIHEMLDCYTLIK